MPRSAQRLPISFDFRPKFPPTGTIHPQNHIPAGKNFQSVEESSRYKPLHRPKPSSHWKNHPTKLHLSGQNPPVTGRIRTDSYPRAALILPANGKKRAVKRNRAQIRRNWTCDYSAALMSCAKRAFHMAPVALITAFAPASRYAL